MEILSKILDAVAHRRRRQVASIIAVIAALGIWAMIGTTVIGRLNPDLKHELAVAMHPPLDVWIAAPAYANAAPVIISTPAGVRFDRETLTVPEGSTLSAHLAEQGGDAPDLVIDGDSQSFTTDAHGDFAATQKLTDGTNLSIRRGWLTLAAWKIHVVPDAAPKVALTDPPSVTASKAVRLAYTASDALGVDKMMLRVTPKNPPPGASDAAIEIPLPVSLSTTPSRQISRVDFLDLADRPWAGQAVELQIVATSPSGQSGVSAPVAFTLPHHDFLQPIARILIEERSKLLQNPDDAKLRDEVANVMAGISQESVNSRADPVVMMALRSGAVRLILNHDRTSAVSVNDILWDSAMRIEEGSGSGQAQRAMSDARQDLATAIDHHAGAEEIEQLTERLQQAIAHYIRHIATRVAAGNGHAVSAVK